MQKTTFLFFLITLFGLPDGLAQEKTSKAYLIQQISHWEPEQTPLQPNAFFNQQKEHFQLSPASSLHLLDQWPGQSNWQHYRYQQYHKQIPVFGATYLLHSQNDQVKRANGHLRPLIDCSTTPALRPSQAQQIALQDLAAQTYIWEESVPQFFRQNLPQASLTLVDPAFPKVSETLRLAYQIDIQSWEPLDKKRYLIDAQSGVILHAFPLLHDHAVPGTAQTKYYGLQDIIIDSIAPTQYHLHDPTRGDGISTYNYDKSLFTNDAAHWDLTNEAQDEVALDAHWCASRYYDLLKTDFAWDGLGNQGEHMRSVVHIGGGQMQVNAFWDGAFAWFGDGDCKNGPLTTLEVVAHEFTHGIIDYTSQLIYDEESGAINESLADIMGKTLEYREDPANFTWELGRTFQYDPNDPPFRSFSDPASLGHPDFYQGALWVDGAGVHTNSSVGNHWFYLLSVGESGINEAGEAYDVPAIGVEQASAIAFLCNHSYLTSSSGYNDFYTLSLQAAEELYGTGAMEITAVAEAWKAVGVPGLVEVFAVDLAVAAPNNARQIFTCGVEYFLPLEFSLTNMGTDTFFPQPNDELQILYNIDGIPYDKFIPLTENILPGAIQDFLVDDFIYAEGDLNIYVTYFLPTAVDDNYTNNTAVVNIRNHEHPQNDLSLIADISDFDCLNNSYQTSFFLINNSCEAMPMGSVIELALQNDMGTVYWSEMNELVEELLPNGSRTFIRDIPHSWKNVNYQLTANLANDPNLDNNVVATELYQPLTLTIAYENDFDSPDFGEGLRVNTRAEPELSDYNGESHFTATGLLPNSYFTLCPTPEDNLRGEYGDFNAISAELIGCADLTDIINPSIYFNLVQFRNNIVVGGSDATSVMEFSYTDANGTERSYFYGQEEGLSIYHEVALPNQFLGQVKFKFADQTGVAGDQADFWEYDVQLLDNFGFNGQQVAVEEPELEKLRLFPNPAGDQLYIQTPLNIERISIVNSLGKIQKAILPVHENTVDITPLSPGYYWVKVGIKDGGEQVIPFVKI